MEHARRGEIFSQWATWLGCEAGDLEAGGTGLVESTEHRRDRILLLRTSSTTLVCTHPERAELVSGLSGSEPLGSDDIRRALGSHLRTVIAPWEILYVDEASFRPAEGPPVRPLGPQDTQAFAELQAASTPREVRLAEVELGQPLVVGAFVDGALAAASSYLLPGGPIADVGVLTHPEFRGRGHGRAVASAVCSEALRRQLIPQWWALVDNHPSLAVGRNLGFRHFAFHERFAV